jgi:cobalt/nickel transport system permease protein
VTASGLERFLSIAVKSWLSVQAAVLLTATTRMPDLLVAMRALKLPRLLIATVSLMWRYLFVLADETMRMLRARTSRSAALDGRGGGSLFWRASVTGAMAGTLFLRGYERSERIYNAMLARGYDGSVRAATQRPLTRGERDIVVVGLVVLASVLTLGRFVG